MDCPDFLERFSEYYDGTAEPPFVSEADAHLDACAACRRYLSVVEQGAEILRAMPPVTVGEDFQPRLQHRIYHLEDGPALAGGDATAGSATTATTALAVAMLIAAAAWSPALMRAPQVDLPPIVVSEPEPRIVGVRPPAWIATAGPGVMVSGVPHRLWDDPRALFTRYSPLMADDAPTQVVVRRADL